MRVEFEKSKQTSHVNGNEERSGGCWNIKLAKYATKVAENMNWDKRKGRGAKLRIVFLKNLLFLFNLMVLFHPYLAFQLNLMVQVDN